MPLWNGSSFGAGGLEQFHADEAMAQGQRSRVRRQQAACIDISEFFLDSGFTAGKIRRLQLARFAPQAPSQIKQDALQKLCGFASDAPLAPSSGSPRLAVGKKSRSPGNHA
jgi:hypothetical protein